jgi:hypothetical protein
MTARNDAPKHILPPPDERQRVLLVVVLVHDLVIPAQDDGRGARLPLGQQPPVRVLVHGGAEAERGHERGHHALVAVELPAHESRVVRLERADAGRTVAAHGVSVSRVHGLLHHGVGHGLLQRHLIAAAAGRAAALLAGHRVADGAAQPALGESLDDPARHDARREDQPAQAADVAGADEARGRQEHERGHEVRERGGEVDADGAAERVPDEAERAVARPGEVRGGEDQQDLGNVQPGVERKVSDTVGVPTAEEVLFFSRLVHGGVCSSHGVEG